jgi:hypothetical protein
MKKKLLIGTGVVIILLTGVLFYLRSATKKHSPNTTVTYNQNGYNIAINYCQPFKKGRIIFGPKETGALQSYGEYWRMGANEATTFNTETALLINGNELPAGKYAIYAIPNETAWTIAFNTENNRWGATAPDEKNDILRVQVPSTETNTIVEQLNISFEPDSNYVYTILVWDNVSVKIPIKLAKK